MARKPQRNKPRPGARPGVTSEAGRERPLGDRFVAVMRLLRVASSRSEIAGLSNARYEFLHALVHGGPTRMSALARHLRISPRTVTPMVDALEAEGLLDRAPDPTDRRAQILTLTPAGFKLMKGAHDARITMADSLFAPLTTSERNTLGALLDKIIDGAGSDPPLPRQDQS